MQFQGGKKGVRPQVLQMYKIPPIEKISLDDFEDFAAERLKVLREVETLAFRKKKDSEEYLTAMRSSMIKKFWKYSFPKDDQYKKDIKGYELNLKNELRKDNTSHFILRLAYCRSEELRRWFIAQEVDLFRAKFLLEAENVENIEKFLKYNGLLYSPITQDEKEEQSKKLAAADFKMTESTVEATEFYKVPFTEVLDLVRSRKVYLEKGFAYVPKENLVSIIGNCFRMHLSHALAVTARALPYMEEDDRIVPRLAHLSEQYIGHGYDDKKVMPGGKITIGQIDSLSKTSFPLCMRQLHEALRKDHHLKHWGRMQYGLFLKGIGLTLEESLMFWRSEFTRVMEVDKFDKQHAYNIRHNYGKEGKRLDYTPYGCMKIIVSNHPGPGDYHGCPFRHSDADILRQKLVAYGVPTPAIKEILDLVKDSHYQLACARYFEVTHKVSLSQADAVNHPNKYVEESRRVHEALSQGNIKQAPLESTCIEHLGGDTGIKTERVFPTNSQNPGDVKAEPASTPKDTCDDNMLMDDLDDDSLINIADMGY